MNNRVYLYVRLCQEDVKASSRQLSLALQALWDKTGLEPEEVLRTEKGKPYFPSGRLHLSVTHTGRLFAVAFAPRPIGIDAERVDEDRPRIAQKKFSPRERGLPFSLVWCGKEAVAKLVGDGLEIINQISVQEHLALYGERRFLLSERILWDTYRLVIATEEGWDYGAETLSEK